MVNFAILNGGRIGLASGGAVYFLEDIADLKPTVFLCSPRFYNFVYSECKEIAFARKEKEGLSNEEMEKILQTEFSKRFGGRIKSIGATAASVPDELVQFLKKTFRGTVGSMYGSTEADGVTAVSG